MELGFWILIVSVIPDSLSCIPDSKAQDFHFHKKNFSDPRIRIPLHQERMSLDMHAWVLTGRIFKSPRSAFLVLGIDCLFWSPARLRSKTRPLVALTSKNVYWLSSVPYTTPYRWPLSRLLTPHDMFLCPLLPCSYALLMNSHFLTIKYGNKVC